MDTENKKSGSKLIPILVFAAIIVIVGLYGFFFLNQEDNVIQGEADVTEVRISSKVPGRIEKYLVEEGSYVKKGDTLAILSIPDVEAKLAQATAAEQGAAAQNQKAIKGARTEQIQGAYEMWQKAVVGVDIAQKSFTRVQNLFNKGVVTAQKRDETEAQLNAAIATEKAAKSQYNMAVNGAEREDKEAALAMLDRAKGAVAEVASYISESYLISPIDGKISEKFPNVGELVGTGAPIMNVAKLDDKWGSFNIREDRLKDYKDIGTTLKAYVPALDKEVEMEVYYVKDLGSYAAWKATKITGQYDRKTFEVKARFKDPTIDVLPGMSLIIKE
ncbi:HlyD family secretion protein [Dysgonomonas sp. PFB1-18]|uniref:HlyD family secretion protein n=1 Tax=unclassified Dysgonomonas TaxID=2630389 RepID=UPI00247546AD|nr:MULTISPECIES: biotin/lipoyl-binding protein [unclassified Dysgonomonas]MDH6310819.1 HlyD family secretion protein [Dysgonomonas sp. PF1-14]MDH6340669.1 HlyD family secretion protein [Dysgonomonas sp. PF1-16]MDH6382224.1 HlyD family secretion protein [Dysgonomonas sp. PFB1-18]MDH6399639.1 HlyD family secretion protein [Dysgonomonas sp. PF1-23]